MITAAPAIPADRFARVRAGRVAAAARMVGLAAGEAPTDEQLAHLAWHVAVIEPSELRHLNLPEPPGRAQPACLTTHRQVPDPLDEVLPLPHPLDYEWRYDPITRMMLADRCSQLSGIHGPIALLGTPTLAAELYGHSGDVLLLDANAALLVRLAAARRLGAIQWAVADLATFSPPQAWLHRAAVVICDPPWYPEGFATFLCAAAQLVRPGGTVLLSVPDLLTRPSVADELDDLRRMASRLRLAISAAEPRTLRYRTPFFEYRALRASGVHLIPLDWRAGTLWQLTSTGTAPMPPAGRHRAAAVSTTVAETTIDGVRLRVLRTTPASPGVLSLRPVVPGDTLPTVSRRHPARSSATLWTSGNTALGCADPELTALLLRDLTDGSGNRLGHHYDQLAGSFARRHQLPIRDAAAALDKISAVVAAERADYAGYCAIAR
jgi:hypothetical protein